MSRDVERTITVDTVSERVWEYLCDFRDTEEWDPGTVGMTRESGDGVSELSVGTLLKSQARRPR